MYTHNTITGTSTQYYKWHNGTSNILPRTQQEVRQEWIRVLNERWSLTRAASLIVASGKDARHKALPRRNTTLSLPATTPPSPGPACALNMCYGSSLRGHQPKVSTAPQPPDQLVARRPPTDTQNPSTNSRDDESQQSTAIGGTGSASDRESIHEQILNPPPSSPDVMHDTDKYVEMKPGTSEDSEYVNVLREATCVYIVCACCVCVCVCVCVLCFVCYVWWQVARTHATKNCRDDIRLFYYQQQLPPPQVQPVHSICATALR